MSDSLKLLEIRVEQAVARLKQLGEERDRLAGELAQLQDHVRGLEAAPAPRRPVAWPVGMIEDLRDVVRGLRGE